MSNNFFVRQILKTGSSFLVGTSIAIGTLCPIVLTSSRVLADSSYQVGIRGDAANELQALAKQNITPKTIAFTPNGEWVIIYDGNGYFPSPNFPPDALNQIVTLNKRKSTINTIAFTPKGEWVIIYDGNGYFPSANFPQDALNAIVNVNKQKSIIKSVAFDPNGGWVVLYGINNATYTNNISPDAIATIVNVHNIGKTFINIAFTPSNGWVLLYNTPNELASPIVPLFNPYIPSGLGGGAIRCANTTSICN